MGSNSAEGFRYPLEGEPSVLYSRSVLSKPYRLRKYRDFSRVYQKGKRSRTDCLAICVYPRSPQTESEPTRIGIAVGQKVSKRAVVRNLIKRRIRAACRQLLPQLKPGRDIVIVARAASTHCEYHEFLQQLKQLFTSAEILHGY